MTPPYGRVIWSIFFQLYSLRRFEVSLHNPSCKLRKTMPTGALSYLNALTDTRRCLPCTIVIRGKRKYVNPHAPPKKLLLWRCQSPSFLRGCAGTATTRERKATPRAKSIHQVFPMLSECASKNSFYICIVIPTRKDSSPGTRSRSPPWPSMIFRTEESPIP